MALMAWLRRHWLLAVLIAVPAVAWLLVGATPAYDRDDWPHWVDADGDCLDTRHEVLQDQSEGPVTIVDCRVVEGSWPGVYSGRPAVTTPADLEIDHVVSLRRAHEAGGWAWSWERRRAYANDSRNLLAVHGDINASKGSRGPDEWAPPDPAAHCRYAAIWGDVTAAYEIVLTAAESAALAQLGGGCP